MTKFEKRFLEFIRNNCIYFGFAALALLGLLIRIALFDKSTSDYSFFMAKWIDALNAAGGFSGLGQSIGEYNVPYMLFLAVIGKTPYNNLYEIKALSIIFDYVGAFAVMLIVSKVLHIKFFSGINLVAFGAIILNPVVFLDSAYWAQCDSINVALCLISMYFLIRSGGWKDHVAAMIFYGLAISMKFQAIFFLPVIIIYYFASQKMRAVNFLIVPIVFFIMDLPAVFAGRGIIDTLSIYLNQTDIYKRLTMGCPSLYSLMPGEYDLFKKAGIYLTLCVLGIGACLFIKKSKVTKKSMILLATWCSFVCVYFLPSMHERYPFIVCLLSIVWAFVYRKDLWVAVGINAVVLFSYAPYLFRVTLVDLKWLSIVNLVILIYLSIQLFSSRRNMWDDELLCGENEIARMSKKEIKTKK